MCTARVNTISVIVNTTLADSPDELRGTTGYFRPESARWTITRGNEFSRDETVRARAWDGLQWLHVEVYGPKTRAPHGGTSGTGFMHVEDIPDWLWKQRPDAVHEGIEFVNGVSR